FSGLRLVRPVRKFRAARRCLPRRRAGAGRDHGGCRRMIRLARTNRSVIAEWWWTVDKWTLLVLMCLMLLGGVLALAASPAVATRINLPPFHFVYRQMVFFIPAIAVMIGVSLL